MKWFVLLTLIFLLGCTSQIETPTDGVMEGKPMPDDYLIATFAGGCFWCTEADFEKVPGVVDVVSGRYCCGRGYAGRAFMGNKESLVRSGFF